VKNFRFVCVALGIVLWALGAVCTAAPARAAQEPSPFTLVQRVGEPHLRYLHMFSTQVGKYTIRHDGFGEVYVGGRKKNFHLKTEARAKIEWVYFYEYQGDLLLLYRAGGSGYLVRLDQKTRKIRGTHIVNHDFEPPLIHEKSIVFSDGTVVPL
jgi:hypothetical protein